jgi:hypothetical protein
VIEKGEGRPWRDSTSTVVATGTAPVVGPWQLEVSGHPGARGRPCLFIVPLDPSDRLVVGGRSGFCGPGFPQGVLGFRKTPGFSRAQFNVPPPGRRSDGSRIRVREVLVYGRVPERAAAVVITAERGVRIEVEPGEGPKRLGGDRSLRGDFFVIPVKPGLGRARVNWLDRGGRPGSRGIALMPPITDS